MAGLDGHEEPALREGGVVGGRGLIGPDRTPNSILRRLLPADITAHLGGSAAGSFVLRVANAALSLAVSILLARLLGPADYGVYAFAFAVITLLALPAQAGLPTLLVRDVAGYEVREEWGLLRGLLRRANQAVAVLTLVVGVGAVAVVLVLGERISGAQRATLLWALTLLPLFALGNLRGAALRGLRRVVQGQLPEFVLRPGLFVLTLLVVWLGGDWLGVGSIELTPWLAMQLHAAAALVAFLVGVWLLRRELPAAVGRAEPSFATRDWLRSLLPLTLLSGIWMINSQMDVVLLGVLRPSAEVGVYRVAFAASTPIIFSLSAVNLVVAPYFSRAHSQGDREQLQRLATWSARIALTVAIPAAAALILFGGPILGFVFGSAYAAGGTALALLAVGQLGNAAAGSVGNVLNMTGYERDTVLGVSVAAAVNLVLNLALIPPFGMVGAATATMTSLLVWNGVLIHRVWRRVGIVSVAWRPGSGD